MTQRERGDQAGGTSLLNASLTAQGKLSKPFVFRSFLQWSSLQGAPSGRGAIFVEILLKNVLCNMNYNVSHLLVQLGFVV